MAKVRFVEGDLTKQRVDVIVNAWNRNFLPFWLLIPQGVSKAIRRVTGNAPFWELRKRKVLATGEAFWTSPGDHKLVKGIIHVAGINAFWIATEYSIRQSTKNALQLAAEKQYQSIAFPVIGAGTGAYSAQRAENFMVEEIEAHSTDLDVTLVRFKT